MDARNGLLERQLARCYKKNTMPRVPEFPVPEDHAKVQYRKLVQYRQPSPIFVSTCPLYADSTVLLFYDQVSTKFSGIYNHNKWCHCNLLHKQSCTQIIFESMVIKIFMDLYFMTLWLNFWPKDLWRRQIRSFLITLTDFTNSRFDT